MGLSEYSQHRVQSPLVKLTAQHKTSCVWLSDHCTVFGFCHRRVTTGQDTHSTSAEVGTDLYTYFSDRTQATKDRTLGVDVGFPIKARVRAAVCEGELAWWKTYSTPYLPHACTGPLLPFLCFNFLSTWQKYSASIVVFGGAKSMGTTPTLSSEVVNIVFQVDHLNVLKTCCGYAEPFDVIWSTQSVGTASKDGSHLHSKRS